jgi:uncharacterized protein (TIGR02246 family)
MTSKLKSAAFIAISALVFASCSTPPKEEATAKPAFDLDKTKVEIQAMEDAFAAAEKAKDAKAVAAYYSEDAISYSRNEEPTKGRAAIQDSIAKRIASDTSGNYSVYKVVDLFGDENMLVEVGSWTSMTPAGAERDHGHYMSYFQKRDGKYQCVRDMNVSSTPAKK